MYFCGILSISKYPIMDIRLSNIALGMPGISPAVGAYLHENCVTLLHRCGHVAPTSMSLKGLINEPVSILWEDNVTEQIERSYADHLENTELSAVCISVLLTKQLTDYTIISRSCIGTGFDYYLGKEEDPTFSPLARLEISGIENETATNTAEIRFKQKATQVEVSDNTGLPAYISVVEFGTPKAIFNKK